MARKKSKKKRTRGEPSVGADSLLAQFLENPRWQLLGRVVMRAAVVVGLVAATYGSLEMRREVLRDPRFQLSRWSFEFGAFPDWVTPRIQDEIEVVRDNAVIGPQAEPGHIFQDGLLARVREVLEANSWIRSVRDLRLSYPAVGDDGEAVAGGLEFALRLRRPVAVVAHGGRYYYVDESGLRLGGEVPEDEVEARGDIPVIRGSDGFARQPAPEPGQRWEVPEILDGIEVAWVIRQRRINERFPENRIVVIDISSVRGGVGSTEAGILLIAEGVGSLPAMEIGWGRSPTNPAKTAPLADVIAKLETVLARPQTYFGDTSTQDVLLRLDLPGRLWRVDRGADGRTVADQPY